MTEYVPLDTGETTKKIAMLLYAPGSDPFLEGLGAVSSKVGRKILCGLCDLCSLD